MYVAGLASRLCKTEIMYSDVQHRHILIGQYCMCTALSGSCSVWFLGIKVSRFWNYNRNIAQIRAKYAKIREKCKKCFDQITSNAEVMACRVIQCIRIKRRRI
jgi:hypothetical protein